MEKLINEIVELESELLNLKCEFRGWKVEDHMDLLHSKEDLVKVNEETLRRHKARLEFDIKMSRENVRIKKQREELSLR